MNKFKEAITPHLAGLILRAFVYGGAGFFGSLALTHSPLAATAATFTALAAFLDKTSGTGSTEQLAATLDKRVNGDPEAAP